MKNTPTPDELALLKTLKRLVKTLIFLIGVVLLILVIGLSAMGVIPLQFLTGDVTGRGINDTTKKILTGWIEHQEQEKSDHYTFSLLEVREGRKTYLVECKNESLSVCKYKIVFVELDEKTGQIVNVEIPATRD